MEVCRGGDVGVADTGHHCSWAKGLEKRYFQGWILLLTIEIKILWVENTSSLNSGSISA